MPAPALAVLMVLAGCRAGPDPAATASDDDQLLNNAAAALDANSTNPASAPAGARP